MRNGARWLLDLALRLKPTGPATGGPKKPIWRWRTMSEWKVFYRDSLDRDRTSQSLPSKEDALTQATNLHRQQRAEIYRIEGSDGGILQKNEIMRWVSDHRW
jgi:hypothetical protein